MTNMPGTPDDDDILDLTEIVDSGNANPAPASSAANTVDDLPGLDDDSIGADFGADLDALLDSLTADAAAGSAPAPKAQPPAPSPAAPIAAPIENPTPVEHTVDPDETLPGAETSDIDSLLAELGVTDSVSVNAAPKAAPEPAPAPAPEQPAADVGGNILDDLPDDLMAMIGEIPQTQAAPAQAVAEEIPAVSFEEPVDVLPAEAPAAMPVEAPVAAMDEPLDTAVAEAPAAPSISIASAPAQQIPTPEPAPVAAPAPAPQPAMGEPLTEIATAAAPEVESVAPAEAPAPATAPAAAADPMDSAGEEDLSGHDTIDLNELDALLDDMLATAPASRPVDPPVPAAPPAAPQAVAEPAAPAPVAAPPAEQPQAAQNISIEPRLSALEAAFAIMRAETGQSAPETDEADATGERLDTLDARLSALEAAFAAMRAKEEAKEAEAAEAMPEEEPAPDIAATVDDLFLPGSPLMERVVGAVCAALTGTGADASGMENPGALFRADLEKMTAAAAARVIREEIGALAELSEESE